MEAAVDVLTLTVWLRKHRLSLSVCLLHTVVCEFIFTTNTNKSVHTRTHSLESPVRYSYLSACTASHLKTLQTSTLTLYLLPCLNLSNTYLDISTSGRISESLSGSHKKQEKVVGQSASQSGMTVFFGGCPFAPFGLSKFKLKFF